jgi:hypothetical protein
MRSPYIYTELPMGWLDREVIANYPSSVTLDKAKTESLAVPAFYSFVISEPSK